MWWILQLKTVFCVCYLLRMCYDASLCQFPIMQLYHTTDITIQWEMLMIHDLRIVSQLKRVMRARPWLQIMIQYPQADHTIRYQCTLSTISDKLVETMIDQQTIHPHRHHSKHLVVAMANKRDKMELIVQKATECGIGQITIVPMQRSVITSSNVNKWKRLELIMLEAVEQSRSTQVPALQWCDHLKHLNLSWQVLLSNMGGALMSDVTIASDTIIIIWPEWWLDDKDIKILEQKQLDLTTISLWSTVLRMETAAIVWSRWINNQ